MHTDNVIERISPKRILAGHKVDPTRRELYVEGTRDKSFLDWLVPIRSRNNASIILIKTVELPDVGDGGERSRLLNLMELVESHRVAIRGLIDADSHRLIADSPIPPSNTWMTDFRDLESYVISQENIRTALQLAFGKDPDWAPSIYESMLQESRWLAALRLVSEAGCYRLPMSDQKWLKHAVCNRYGMIEIKREKALSGLIQSASHSLKILDAVAAEVAKSLDDFASVPDRNIVHGKDAMALLTHQFATIGCNVMDLSPILWSTFRPEHLVDFPTLVEVIDYLKS